ncbi:hypothetical protein ILUMI_11088 [Ignelater luminosus]|uniref:PH domain-containing protein n=1 Tax=Ignelater luminosus TaxID=2038154 RepID=A0A8K0D223_IGNLU|nr:hypothetical protein ILUMI_11088 [Ignelater luminosus]
MANINTHPVVKISGYLEKKAKLRIGSPWKKYWFVLEGRLLLYYRSKDEYETLSPCKGSINLCPPCNVKPALSAACVFQIECRASTVTLRAESRQEQERWMQALLAAIAQSKSSPSRMSHFRYSLDDLPMSAAEDKKSGHLLSRQNTMPHRISSSPKPKRNSKSTIIERLQNIGAQTYGGSLNTITKLANKDQSEEKRKDVSKDSEASQEITYEEDKDQVNNNKSGSEKQLLPKPPHKSSSSERIQNLFTENEQYSIIQEENSIDLRLDEQTTRLENPEKVKSLIVENDQYVINSNENKPLEIKENISENKKKKSFMLENDQYIYLEEEKTTNEEASFIRSKEIRRTEHLYERISNDSSISEYSRNSKGKQNSLYERISGSSTNSDTHVNKVNAQYSVVHKDGTKQKTKTRKSVQENEYSVPVIDHNKNTLLVDNDQYIPTIDDKSNDNEYSDGLIYTPEYSEYAAIDKTKELEDLYEDPDHIKKQQTENSTLYQDIEPVLPPRPDYKRLESSEETSSQSSSNEGKKSKHRFKLLSHIMKSDKKSEGKPKTKRRATSFLNKMWRRKAKSLDSEDDITYETVDYEIIEKQIEKDRNDLEMLQELQKILEARKNLLQVKLNSSETKGEKPNQPTESKVQPIVEVKEEESLDIRSARTVEEIRPSLPPRQSQSLSPYHDVPQNNQAVNNICDNKNVLIENSANSSTEDNNKDSNINKLTKNIKTIDDILKDLDEEKDIRESRQKVRQLIEKFNDIQNDDEVVLRKKSKTEISKSRSDTKLLQTLKRDNLSDKANRESDELTILLEELSKVTCAPVLTPGVTSSLVNPMLTDDEWLQLIPIRRRRLSDPDYDVPRPHRSLQLHGSTKQVQDNPIPATRFFGPILPPSSTDENM